MIWLSAKIYHELSLALLQVLPDCAGCSQLNFRDYQLLLQLLLQHQVATSSSKSTVQLAA